MSRNIQASLCVILVITGRITAGAQTTALPGPPPWPDRASAYLLQDERAAEASAVQHAVANGVQQPAPEVSSQAIVNDVRNVALDPAVVPAAAAVELPTPTTTDQRYLAQPSDSTSTAQAGSSPASPGTAGQRATRRVAELRAPTRAIYTVASALAIVLGLLLACVWLLRRSTRNTNVALPADVVGVLGRVPLAARQFAQLLRVGNKLVLISLTPSGATTLTEIIDPTEVDRLAGLCQQSDPHSTTKAFEQVFRQLSREPAAPGFFGGESLPASPPGSPSANLFRTERDS